MRTRLSTLFLVLAPCLLSSYALAESQANTVLAIEDQLFSKHTELKNALQIRKEQQATVSQYQNELKQIQQQGKTLSEKFQAVKAQLETDYQRMIDDPSVDLAATQAAYQDVWKNIKQNQNEQLNIEQQVEEANQLLTTHAAQVSAIEQDINQYDKAKLRARVNRLKAELSPEQQVTVSFTNRCQSDMTLAQCDAQTRDLALQKAVKTFQALLIEQTTESKLVQGNVHKAALNIHVMRHKAKKSGFYDGQRYRTILDVSLEARPNDSAACSLLGVDKQYCFDAGYISGQQFQDEQEIAWVTLDVRSNQYNDQVFVDGVSYGSTPVEIMLPVGQHHLVIKKEGYRNFEQNLAINSDRSFRANLKQKANVLRAGDKFADLISKDVKAPQLVAIVPGEYLIGEHASNQYFLDHAFGIGATPVTVSQFDHFVRQTDYQTDAEMKNTCTAIENGEVTAIEKSYWRNPGFKQFANSPVVCVSRNDANAYTKWLSAQTGFQYRLPSEDEWEIAARAGSQADYWWGNHFVTGDANTGWSSSQWANTSTAPVDAFKANPLGIYDSVGNVWQWTNDSHGIAKGGAWNFSPAKAVAHERLYLSSASAANYVGFRVVRSIN
ncbi:SUMF1/EgtB/PvdO family nonheme iron enzyme [Vibrio kasasachensis]|uniref:SUMF1/EgtB/PvdO family nonheme iron enzyme n=1 Tax=Vibrio kasasachensis TaxID=2910248 RepID=UPI003D10973F